MSEIVQHDGGELEAARDAEHRLTITNSILSDDEVGRVWRIATSLAASGMFKGAESAALTETQAFAKILLGRDLGLSPTRALMTLDIVKGNIQFRGKLLLAWVRASENYDYEVVERTPEKGAIRFYEKSKRTGEWEALEPVIEFTAEQARAKGLVRTGSAWEKWPEAMCIWRCASIGVNLFMPDLTGGTPVYTEADDFADRTPAGGQGDGSEPGWHGLSVKQAERAERLLERADALREARTPGIPLALASRATLQMRLNRQSPHVIDQNLSLAAAALEALVGAGATPETVDGDAVDLSAEPDKTPEDTGEGVDGAQDGQDVPVVDVDGPTLTDAERRESDLIDALAEAEEIGTPEQIDAAQDALATFKSEQRGEQGSLGV